jgi:hypothetical protein
VVDRSANFPLTVQRYALSDTKLSFVPELMRDVAFSFIAHALVCGPTSQADTLAGHRTHPLLRIDTDRLVGEWRLAGHLRWCSTAKQLVPADPWFYSLLEADTCVVCGALYHKEKPRIEIGHSEELDSVDVAMFPWYDSLRRGDSPRRVEGLLRSIARRTWMFGHRVKASRLVVSLDRNATLQSSDWTTILDKRKKWLATTRCDLTPKVSLERLLRVVERCRRTAADVFFVVEYRTRRTKQQPQSVVAKAWNESLGPRPIPLDPASRMAFVADGLRHSELKRHIEAWQELKATDSGWSD